jgi:hypothetical protein
VGFIKSIEDEATGVVATYWEPAVANSDILSAKSSCALAGYVNKAAYDAGKKPVMVRTLDIPAGASTELFSAVKAFVEAFAKTQADFEGWTSP